MTKPICPTLNSTKKLIRSLGPLTPKGEVQAEICLRLAEQIDVATGSHTGSQSMAIPGLAKQLETSLAALLVMHPVEDSFLGYLLAADEEATSEDEWKAQRAGQRAAEVVAGVP